MISKPFKVLTDEFLMLWQKSNYKNFVEKFFPGKKFRPESYFFFCAEDIKEVRLSNQIPSSDIPKVLAQIPSQEKFHTEASYFNSDY